MKTVASLAGNVGEGVLVSPLASSDQNVTYVSVH